eukprot:TRINITY_DN13878_c0_g1_i2.p1 TRINITY_DN13878_c0_g1~~TRINITY_DN13878_c0_g1_i2.p1  ORF type:complete len:570 (-),score=109.06 TRINITY_DN13878_c0_g1_i2:349-2058(-)
MPCSTRSFRSNSTLHYSPFVGTADGSINGDNFDLGGVVSRRQLGWIAVSTLVYFNVSGGPFGSEGIIPAAGPIVGLVALVVYPIIFALPVALVTAELTTAFPEDGGYTIWVNQSFGSFWGFQEGYWSWISGVVDNATYPAIAMAYWDQMLSDDTSTDDSDDSDDEDVTFHSWVIKAGIVTVLTLLNVAGLRCVDRVLVVITIGSIIPFIAFIILSSPHLDFSNCLKAKSPMSIKMLYKLLKLLFWNFNGFDGVSTFAGEVKDPRKSYTRGLGFALIFMSLTYLLPLLFATALNPTESPWEDWGIGDNGFPIIFKYVPGVGTWLAVWMFCGAMLAQFGQFMTELLIDSYQLHGMALQGMVPAVFAHRLPPKQWGSMTLFDTPCAAIFASWAIMMLIVTRNFEEILDVDNVLTCFSLLLELVAAVWLRFKMPDLERPYKVPVGKWGFLALCSLPFSMCALLVVITIYMDFQEEMKVVMWIAVLVAVGAIAPLIAPVAKRRGWWKYLDPENLVGHSPQASQPAEDRVASMLPAHLSDPPPFAAGGVLDALTQPLRSEPEPLESVMEESSSRA